MDLTTTVLEGHKEEVDKLHTELVSLQDKLDAENRARRDNLRIRGLPETLTDLQRNSTAFFLELAPDIPPERFRIWQYSQVFSP